MTDINILTFQDSIDKAGSKKHLLLGNGFSIALMRNIFSYDSLLEKADFSTVPHAEELFETLNTQDFEAVIRLLVDMEQALRCYDVCPPDLLSQVKTDATEVKTILANAIAQNHPNRPFDVTDNQYAACRSFLWNFQHIYTLNYDVLLYWALMKDDVDGLKIRCDDEFRNSEENEDALYVSWQDSHSSTVHFLHGALHIFDAGYEVTKFTWSKTEIAIVDQIRAALNEDKYPLFVAEGHSHDKLNKIMHSAYLHKALRSFSSIGGSLFIFGHSLDDNDDHVLDKIPTSKIQDLFVGLHDDSNSTHNQKIINKARKFQEERSAIRRKPQLNVYFYDASTAKVWGGEEFGYD